MKKGLSKKINLANYGGNQYEMLQAWVEQEDGEKKTFVELEKELNDGLEGIIHRLPLAQERLKDSVDPTIIQSKAKVINQPKPD